MDYVNMILHIYFYVLIYVITHKLSRYSDEAVGWTTEKSGVRFFAGTRDFSSL
jgi:hypothetical protein